MENNEIRYIIPRRLVKNSTIFEGIGLKEVGIVGIGILIGLLLFGIFAFIGNFLLQTVFLLIPIGVTVALVVPLSYGENLIIMLKRRKQFKKNQQVFYYIRGTR